MKKTRMGLIALALVLALAVSGVLLAASAAENTKVPNTKETVWGTTVSSNEKGAIDTSNVAEGYISATYTGNCASVRVQITKDGGETYTYTLSSPGQAEVFPLSEGSGSYTVRIYEGSGPSSNYYLAYGATVTAKLRDELLPYLYPNQFVDYTPSSQIVSKAVEITAGKQADLDKLTAIYNYVVDNIAYDYDLANTVQSGYVPHLDSVLSSKKGICFDYASVMCAMLRSQHIPAKMIFGYAGNIYHAWIDVYIESQGWIQKAIYFDGTTWKLMDPTFASTSKSKGKIAPYVPDTTVYSAKYVY